ncbi:rod shape-determining protein [Capnocytophaga catalasegens]|uniref:Cell shape-determining protein MreB n=2 Tax=Capnocytophaga catalasegens TaxID=1004260 RepID=A0AAV5APG5_9FLAO|nr:rod shape-determining protein [Capnocytophaga catalasegens]GJM49228.1 rod shape-determining protein [Capnocytophaga catalasegens]GJM53129.1 rod shape-determining protein [Capnocytophaga catalasegens]
MIVNNLYQLTIMGFFDFLTEEIAIDLGTANTLIIHNDKVVVDSPSIVAKDRTNNKIIAVGKEAQMMQGKTHENIKTIRPLKDGVIADFDASEQMINILIKSIPGLNRRFFSPSLKIVVCIPSGITEVEMRAVRESCERVNGKEIFLIHEPMAAAIGIGLDIMQPKGNMIIDIGGGTAEIAIIALGGIVCDKSVKIAGDVFTDDIIYYMRTQHNLYIGETTAETIKITIGSAIEELDIPPEDMMVQGRDLLSGKPKQVQISYREVAKALDKSILRIEEAIMETLSQTPPELAADIYNTGIYMAGGGSMLRGLDKRISMRTDLPVYVAEDPLRAVVRGTGITLKNIQKFKTILIK